MRDGRVGTYQQSRRQNIHKIEPDIIVSFVLDGPLSNSFTRLSIIAASSHQNVITETPLDVKRSITAAVASPSKVAQRAITLWEWSSHMACMPGSEQMFFISAMSYIPAVGEADIADSMAMPPIVELGSFGVIVMLAVDIVFVVPGMLVVAVIIIFSVLRRFSSGRKITCPPIIHLWWNAIIANIKVADEYWWKERRLAMFVFKDMIWRKEKGTDVHVGVNGLSSNSV